MVDSGVDVSRNSLQQLMRVAWSSIAYVLSGTNRM
jgi:hypothetical protein